MGTLDKKALEALDAYIRSGKGAIARKELKRLAGRKIARKEAVKFAALARRANLPYLGLKALNPIVRPTHKTALSPTLAESAEYAACLTMVGAGHEALTILDDLSPQCAPIEDYLNERGLSNFSNRSMRYPRAECPHLDDPGEKSCREDQSEFSGTRILHEGGNPNTANLTSFHPARSSVGVLTGVAGAKRHRTGNPISFPG